jgi:DNA repair protein SbcC/Rad50
MLLQQLKLKNVRSYTDETINFNTGSTLLSGDIGSGKSTTLLAIEFALFGTSRPDLPGEALLRKGTSQASVELSFKIDQNEIIIQRNLRKDKDNIKQTAGHLIINNVKEELTPLELKAKIITLLGYPEEFVTKNKNYVFRYTIYTPQEEMKFILQDSAESRLDVLRKIFNVDKYKNIRDSLQISLKQMRTKIAILKTKTENIEEKKLKLNTLIEEKKSIDNSVQKLLPSIKQLKLEIELINEEIISLESKHKQSLEIKQKLSNHQSVLKEKETQIKYLLDQKESFKQGLDNYPLPENISIGIIKDEVEELEKKKTSFLTQRASLNEKINLTQERIKELKIIVDKDSEQINKISEKDDYLNLLKKEVSEKKSIKEKIVQLEPLLEKTTTMMTQNKTLLEQAQKLKEKISGLTECPTCLQKVSDEHKRMIEAEEDRKTKQAENLLFELKKKRSLIVNQKEDLSNTLDQLIIKENNLTRVSLELEHLRKIEFEFKNKTEQLKQFVQENNLLMQQLSSLQKDESILETEKKINELRHLLDLISKKESLVKQILVCNQQIGSANELIQNLNNDIKELQLKCSQTEDLTPKIELFREKYKTYQEKEKNLAIEFARLESELKNTSLREKEISDEVNILNNQYSQLVRLKELYHWLDAHFLKLTYVIEKQVMLNIHRLFNQLFQEWFSILIEDENIYSKIDDSFTPIIEQNGYEMNFFNLSGGEKTSAALAYRLALNKVINDVIGGVQTKELLILDEPTDGFSSEQLDKVRDVLERLSLKQVIIVSHEQKIESFVENIIRINKSGHVSNKV